MFLNARGVPGLTHSALVILTVTILSACDGVPFADFLDQEGPVAGGAIEINDLEFERFVANWPAASDVGTRGDRIEYAVAVSRYEPIDTFAEAEINALFLSDWQTNRFSFSSDELDDVLDGSQYLVNVFTRNRDGFIGAYDAVSFTVPAQFDLFLVSQTEQRIVPNTSTFGGPVAFATGLFVVPSAFTNDMAGVAVADITLDGYPDVIMGRTTNSIVSYFNIAADVPLDPFFELQTLPAEYTNYSLLEIADVNGDGLSDLVTGRPAGGAPLAVLQNVSVFFSGQSIAQDDPDWATFTVDPAAFVLADFNDDALPDLAVAQGSGAIQTNVLFLNDGDGVFVSGTRDVSDPVTFGTNTSRGLAAGLVSGDENVDLISATSTGIELWIGDGEGSITQNGAGDLFAGSDIVSIAIGDIDGDGDEDLVVDSTPQPLQVFLAVDFTADSGTWSGPIVPQGGPVDGVSVQLADFDGDGDLDLVAVETGAPNFVHAWENTGATTDTDVNFVVVPGFPYFPGAIFDEVIPAAIIP